MMTEYSYRGYRRFLQVVVVVVVVVVSGVSEPILAQPTLKPTAQSPTKRSNRLRPLAKSTTIDRRVAEELFQQGNELLDQAVEEMPSLLDVVVLAVVDEELQRDPALGAKAGVDLDQLQKAAQQQAGADQQHQRQGDLGDGDRPSHPLAAARAQRAPAAVAQAAA